MKVKEATTKPAEAGEDELELEGITRNDDGTTSVELLEPVSQGEEELRTLTIRKPTARDLEATDAVQGDMKKANALLAHLCGLSLATVRKLSAEDAVRAQGVVARHMGKFR